MNGVKEWLAAKLGTKSATKSMEEGATKVGNITRGEDKMEREVLDRLRRLLAEREIEGQIRASARAALADDTIDHSLQTALDAGGPVSVELRASTVKALRIFWQHRATMGLWGRSTADRLTDVVAMAVEEACGSVTGGPPESKTKKEDTI